MTVVTVVPVVTVVTVVTKVTIVIVVTVVTKKICHFFLFLICAVLKIVTKHKNSSCEKTQKLEL